MKTMKKLLSSLLVVMLMAAMLAVPASAESTYSLTIHNEKPGHTYEAYQIFKGTLAEVGVAHILSDIAWGNGVTADGKTIMGDAKTAAASLTVDNVAAFAVHVAQYLNPANVKTVSTQTNITIGGQSHKAYVIAGLEPGYYLVKDSTGTLNGNEDAHTSYILEVVKNVTVEPKGSLPSVTKKVGDINDSVATARDGWHDSADYDRGDHVPFQITGTLPSNYAEYGSYKYIFHDTMSSGLTFDSTSVKVYVDGTEISSGYEVKTTDITDGCSFHIEFADLKQIPSVQASSSIVAEYTAVLNETAGSGNSGASNNTVCLEYSNDPYSTTTTGKTAEDKVAVFTFDLVIDKVNINYEDLEGADFKVEKYIKSEGTWVDLTSRIVKTYNDTTFTIHGVDGGFYRITETMTPSGYNSIEPFIMYINATHQIEDVADPKLTKLEAGVSNEAGEILPGTGHESFGTADLAQGTIPVIIINKAGSTLPSTGGIGTTIFYIAGAALMIGAGAVLATKKRTQK